MLHVPLLTTPALAMNIPVLKTAKSVNGILGLSALCLAGLVSRSVFVLWCNPGLVVLPVLRTYTTVLATTTSALLTVSLANGIWTPPVLYAVLLVAQATMSSQEFWCSPHSAALLALPLLKLFLATMALARSTAKLGCGVPGLSVISPVALEPLLVPDKLLLKRWTATLVLFMTPDAPTSRFFLAPFVLTYRTTNRATLSPARLTASRRCGLLGSHAVTLVTAVPKSVLVLSFFLNLVEIFVAIRGKKEHATVSPALRTV